MDAGVEGHLRHVPPPMPTLRQLHPSLSAPQTLHQVVERFALAIRSRYMGHALIWPHPETFIVHN